MNTTINNNGNRVANGSYRPRLSFYHPNGKGTGGAVRFELHPAHDNTDGSIMMSAANQMSVSSKSDNGSSFARFDWENRIVVKLDFNDLSRVLQVLRGECESVNDGKGLYHRTASFSTRIVFRHIIEPINGYSLELYRTCSNGDERRSHVVFNAAEALGLCEAIAGSMSVISFGIPMVIPHDTTQYREENRGNGASHAI